MRCLHYARLPTGTFTPTLVVLSVQRFMYYLLLGVYLSIIHNLTLSYYYVVLTMVVFDLYITSKAIRLDDIIKIGYKSTIL